MTWTDDQANSEESNDAEEHDWSEPLRVGDAFYLSQSASPPREVVLPDVRPRSARYVGSVEWAWGPAHSRLDTLYLSLDRSRKFYLLWFEWAEDGYSESRVVAYMPREGADSKTAAFAMTVANYRGEEIEYRSHNGQWAVYAAGLLTHEKLMLIASSIWPANRNDQTHEHTDEGVELESGRVAPSSRALDELLLAEVVLTREAQRALSGGVLGIGGLFSQASEAVEACAKSITDRYAPGVATSRTAAAAHRAIEAISRLEARLPPAPGRFTRLLNVLEELGGTL